MMSINSFLERNGQRFEILRNGKKMSEELGLHVHENNGKACIDFRPEADVRINDWLINAVGERLRVIDITTQFFHSEPHQLKAYYLTEAEYNRRKNCESGTVFNIGHVTGSIIGNNNVATLNYQNAIDDLKERVKNEPEDTDELNQIVNLLEMIVNNQIPVQKGLFSRFSNVLEKHSWLSSSIMGAIFSWLTTLIP